MIKKIEQENEGAEGRIIKEFQDEESDLRREMNEEL